MVELNLLGKWNGVLSGDIRGVARRAALGLCAIRASRVLTVLRVGRASFVLDPSL